MDDGRWQIWNAVVGNFQGSTLHYVQMHFISPSKSNIKCRSFKILIWISGKFHFNQHPKAYTTKSHGVAQSLSLVPLHLLWGCGVGTFTSMTHRNAPSHCSNSMEVSSALLDTAEDENVITLLVASWNNKMIHAPQISRIVQTGPTIHLLYTRLTQNQVAMKLNAKP